MGPSLGCKEKCRTQFLGFKIQAYLLAWFYKYGGGGLVLRPTDVIPTTDRVHKGLHSQKQVHI